MSPGLLLWGGVVLIVGAAIVIGVTLFTSGRTGVAASLSLIEKSVSPGEVGRSELSARERLVVPAMGVMRRLGARLAPSGTPARLRRNLELAGNPAGWSLERLFGFKGVGIVVGVVLGLLVWRFTLAGLLAALVLGAALFFLPDLLLYNEATKRQDALRLGLADALDLLTLCVEAGQAFNAALLQAGRSTTGPISGEFARVLSEIQIGKSRAEAFAALAGRTTASEFKTFVTAITQADRLGLPLGAVLREQSHQMRTVRRQIAEEKAQQVPVKVVFPMLLFIFPALFIVVIGPGVVNIITSFARL